MPFSGLWTLQPIHSSPLTINHTQVPSTQTDFPVLVNFTNTRFKTIANGGHVARSDAFDLGFYSDAGGTTKLKWEVERYNPSTGEIVAWVKIPSVSSASDTVFYAFYGDSSIHTDQSDPVNTFSNSFQAVYHLKDGTTLSTADSRNANNGTNHGATAATGQIDGGASFASASTQYIDCGTNISGPAAMTFSGWANGTTFPGAYQTMFGYISGTANYLILYVKSTGKLACYMRGAGSATSYDGTGSNTLSTSTWYYLVVTYSSTNGLKGYVNGGLDGTAGQVGILTSSLIESDIGRDNANGRYWNGPLDEQRAASVERSADWITCEYNNQQTSSTFVTLGTET